MLRTNWKSCPPNPTSSKRLHPFIDRISKSIAPNMKFVIQSLISALKELRQSIYE